MSELEDKLNSILGDPQTMGQIMALAQSLGGGKAAPSPAPPSNGSETDQEPSPPPPAPPAESPTAETGNQGNATPDLSALLGGLMGGTEGGLDPRLLALFSRVMQEYQSDDSGKVALLQALRPYVKEKRYNKLDKAIQIARLSRLIRVALDVFKGDRHV